MTPHPQLEYIITEEQLSEFEHHPVMPLSLGNSIRSRPHSSQQSRQCPHWLVGWVAGIDGDTNEYFCNAQTRKDERDKVLEKAWVRIETMAPDEGIHLGWVLLSHVKAVLDGLRSTKGGEQG